MPGTDLLMRKMQEAAREASTQENLSKGHIAVTYLFQGQPGRRILRLEGKAFDGSDLYYDYRTKKVKTVAQFEKYWGVTNISATHTIDLQSLKYSEMPQTPAQQPAQQTQPPTWQAPWQGQPPPQTPSQPPMQQTPAPIQPSPGQNQPPSGQAPLKTDLLPKKTWLELNTPAEPPQGKPAPKRYHSANTEITRSNMPIFSYFNRYYPGTIHCAAIAWGLILPHLLAEEGKAAVIFPVSSWKAKDYVEKHKEISVLCKNLQISPKTNKELFDLLANTGGRLEKGAIITLDSGHSYEGKRQGDPTHTMVYSGAAWYDNRTDAKVSTTVFKPGRASPDRAEFEKMVYSTSGGKWALSDEEFKQLADEGAWLQKGGFIVERSNGEYWLHLAGLKNTEFSRLGRVPILEDGTANIRQALSIIHDPALTLMPSDIAKINALQDGRTVIVSPEIGGQYQFSSTDGGSQRAIQLFNYDVFKGFAEEGKTLLGLDGRSYSLRRELDESGKREVISVYSSPSSVVFYSIKRSGASLEVSAKRDLFLEHFSWAKNSGVYQVDFSKMPPAKERIISTGDFGLDKATAEGFAALLSKTYGIQFEYCLNEIMLQNGISQPRAAYKSLTVQLAVMVPDAAIGRILNVPMEYTETPETKKWWDDFRKTAEYVPMENREIFDQILWRREEYFRRCAQIDEIFYNTKIPSVNVDALKVILYNEMFSSPRSQSDAAFSGGYYSNRELKKHQSRALFGISGSSFGDAVESFFGKDSYIDSWGFFQSSINYVIDYLDGNKPIDFGGKTSRAPDAALGQERREHLISLLSSTAGNEKAIEALGAWQGAGFAEERRETVAGLLENDMAFALFFVNRLYSENKRILEEQARLQLGRNYNSTDLEMTACFAYNRGILRANIGIFQQNLLIVAQNLASSLSSKADDESKKASLRISALIGRFAIDGMLGSDGKSVTFDLFKEVCAAKGIVQIESGGKALGLEGMNFSDFHGIFGEPGNYRAFARFFSMPQFRGSDFSNSYDRENAAPYPTLKYNYLSQPSMKRRLTAYL
ncbi:MAG: hypothetical protein WC717_06405, partial [Candidatus Micrarchaeia archaeon]